MKKKLSLRESSKGVMDKRFNHMMRHIYRTLDQPTICTNKTRFLLSNVLFGRLIACKPNSQFQCRLWSNQFRRLSARLVSEPVAGASAPIAARIGPNSNARRGWGGCWGRFQKAKRMTPGVRPTPADLNPEIILERALIEKKPGRFCPAGLSFGMMRP